MTGPHTKPVGPHPRAQERSIKTKLHLRRQWSVGEKLLVIHFAETTNNHQAAREFPIQFKQVRTYRKNFWLPGHGKDAWSQSDSPSGLCSKKNFFNMSKTNGHKDTLFPPSLFTIQAAKIAKLQRSELTTVTFAKAMFSKKWVRRFMERNRLSIRRRTTVAQKLPEEQEELQQNFLSFILHWRMKFDYPLSQIGNMDEVPLTFDMVPNLTVTEKGSKTITINSMSHEKSNFTCVLGILADGTKLPILNIFKLKKLPCGIRLDGVHLRTNPKCWMNEVEMMWWIENVWRKRSNDLSDPRSLLILHSFRGHIVDPVKQRLKDMKTMMAVIPGGRTSRLQRLDVAVNRSFKANLRSLWVQWMNDEEKELTKTGRYKRPSYELVCQWTATACDRVDPDLFRRSFKMTGTSVRNDGSEDDEIFNFCDDEEGDEGDEVDIEASLSDEEGEEEEEEEEAHVSINIY